MGYSAWSRKQLDMTEHTNTHMSVLDSFPHKCVVLHSLKKKKDLKIALITLVLSFLPQNCYYDRLF